MRNNRKNLLSKDEINELEIIIKKSSKKIRKLTKKKEFFYSMSLINLMRENLFPYKEKLSKEIYNKLSQRYFETITHVEDKYERIQHMQIGVE